MSIHSVAILAVWSALLVVIGALTAHAALPSRLRRPVPQPLLLDPLDYDRDGPVIDLEAA
ncbi:hypothetical protein MMSR116_04010 [Methylobacterium mesophilicum SR1.6/6]|jgi:hypothetical protein|uniref:Uncharacterized protein n=1 Tax=Methylobacterium mesophilicum SR1.6/6 TaxID=908290 RepID=A0A6B9FG75_9HYPH|nr:hypothetical protein MMSR116_04010 [Methylobacterium mesophilicum SR1.6/6]